MKIGVSAFAWTAQFTEAHLALLPGLRAKGIEGLEVPMFRPAVLPVQAIRRAFAAEGLACTVCAILPPDINPISPEKRVRAQALAHLRQCLETAAEMGAHLLGGPVCAPIGYLPFHRRTDDERAWAVECLQALTPMLDAYAMLLAVEPVNRAETHFLNTCAQARALCEAVGHARVGVTLDTFHANIEEKHIAQAAAALGSRLLHLHLSENDRGLLGSGHVDFAGVLRAVDGYQGWLMIEGFGYAPDAPGALLAARDVSPEDVAYGGAAYLRALLDTLQR